MYLYTSRPDYTNAEITQDIFMTEVFFYSLPKVPVQPTVRYTRNNTFNHKGNVRHTRTAHQATTCVLPSIKVTHTAQVGYRAHHHPVCGPHYTSLYHRHKPVLPVPMHTQPPRLSILNPLISSSFVWHPANALQDQSIE